MINFLRKLFGKPELIEHKPLERVEMVIKVSKPTPSNSFDNGKSTTKQNSGTSRPNKDPVRTSSTSPPQMFDSTRNTKPIYISLISKTIVKHSKLKYLGTSRIDGYPVYEVIGNDIDFLKKSSVKYKEVIMSPSTLRTYR